MADQTVLDLEQPAIAEPAPSDSGLTAKHMVEMLRRHYLPDGRPPAGVFAPEIGSPDGKRRADLIWLPTTIAGGTGLHGHEIKVSRSDLLAELDDPTKADPWAQYCTRWWLVVSRPALISGLDIPDAWGVMSPPSGRRTRTMTVIKQAPALTPKEPGPGIARLAAWQLYGTNDRMAELARERTRYQQEAQQLRRRVEELEAGGARRADPNAARVARILAAVEDRMRRADLWADADDETIIAAIVDHQAAIDTADKIRGRLRLLTGQLDRIVRDPLRGALDDLCKAEDLAFPAASPGDPT